MTEKSRPDVIPTLRSVPREEDAEARAERSETDGGSIDSVRPSEGARAAHARPSHAPIPDTEAEVVFQSMSRPELADYLREVISFFPKGLPQRWSRMMLEHILCPRGYWHDLDAPLVQEVLITLRDEGLVNLVYRDGCYISFNEEVQTRTGETLRSQGKGPRS